MQVALIGVITLGLVDFRGGRCVILFFHVTCCVGTCVSGIKPLIELNIFRLAFFQLEIFAMFSEV